MTTAYGYIYKITNTANGKVYIGQTVHGFKRRYTAAGDGIERVHKYLVQSKNGKRNYNSHLLNAIELYGYNAFTVDEEFAIAYSKQELDDLEMRYIAQFDADNPKHGYNKESGGSHGIPNQETREKMRRFGSANGFYGRKHTEEMRRRLSEARKGTKLGKDNPNYGHHWSPEMRKAMSDKYKGVPNYKRRGKKMPREAVERVAASLREGYASGRLRHPRLGAHWDDEHKRKASERMMGRYTGNRNPNHKPVICVTTGIRFETINEAAEYAGVTPSRISAILHSGRGHAGKLNSVPLEWKFA